MKRSKMEKRSEGGERKLEEVEGWSGNEGQGIKKEGGGGTWAYLYVSDVKSEK